MSRSVITMDTRDILHIINSINIRVCHCIMHDHTSTTITSSTISSSTITSITITSITITSITITSTITSSTITSSTITSSTITSSTITSSTITSTTITSTITSSTIITSTITIRLIFLVNNITGLRYSGKILLIRKNPSKYILRLQTGSHQYDYSTALYTEFFRSIGL